jgi:hypothetical protein
MITGKLYDQLKFLAQILLPALGTLYFTLAQIWGLPSAENVVGTIVAVDAFLGVLLGISQVNYSKHVGQGDLMVEEDESGKSAGMRLVLDETPEDLIAKHEVRFRVKKQSRRAEKK